MQKVAFKAKLANAGWRLTEFRGMSLVNRIAGRSELYDLARRHLRAFLQVQQALTFPHAALC